MSGLKGGCNPSGIGKICVPFLPPLATHQKSPATTGHRAFLIILRTHGNQTPEYGCLAVSFLASISVALGSFFIARAMASFVAS